MLTASEATWLSMGGYALYVWPAFLVVVFVLVTQFVWHVRRQRKILSTLTKRQRTTVQHSTHE